MKRVLVALIVAALAGGAWRGASFAQPGGQVDGTWTAVTAERNGTPADELKGNRLTFAGDTFVIQRDGKTLYKGTFKADPTRTPAHIDFHHTGGELMGKTWRGVYVLEGDTLRVADNAPDMAKPRPTALTAKAGSGHVMVVFKRAAP